MIPSNIGSNGYYHPDKVVRITMEVRVHDPNVPDLCLTPQQFSDILRDCVESNFEGTVIMKDTNKSGFIHPAWRPTLKSCAVHVRDVDLGPLPFWRMVWRLIMERTREARGKQRFSNLSEIKGLGAAVHNRIEHDWNTLRE